jgi:hypothetical protein
MLNLPCSLDTLCLSRNDQWHAEGTQEAKIEWQEVAHCTDKIISDHLEHIQAVEASYVAVAALCIERSSIVEHSYTHQVVSDYERMGIPNPKGRVLVPRRMPAQLACFLSRMESLESDMASTMCRPVDRWQCSATACTGRNSYQPYLTSRWRAASTSNIRMEPS